MSRPEGALLNPDDVVSIAQDESIITDYQLVERYGYKPLGEILPHAPHDDCTGCSPEEILRDMGLNPERYYLERVWELSAWRVKRREEVPSC